MRIALLCILLALPALADRGGSPIDAMDWITGTWQGPMGGGTFVAWYSKPSGGNLVSYSVLKQGENVAFYEFEVWEARKDAVTMTPYPGGKKRVTFKLTESGKRKAVFENAKNDFPSKLVYHRVADDNLVITLTGSGKTRTYDLKRTEGG